ncbi:hypothetical protein BGZ49_007805 [Haplosporangium sp. Z 27]|nr:hypothetical protein BGZ49_007805 [Haplosporangium sp. Z 27]
MTTPKNIRSMGEATNKVIKSLIKTDKVYYVEALLQYLINDQVCLKNTSRITFDTSLKVFVRLEQTSINSTPSEEILEINYESLKEKYQSIYDHHAKIKEERALSSGYACCLA